AEPAGGGGQAPGPAPVRAQRERPLTGSDRRGGAAGRAPGSAREIPWVARGPEQRAVGERLVAELGGGGLADQDRAGLAQPPPRPRGPDPAPIGGGTGG